MLDYVTLKKAIIDFPDLEGEADIEANIALIVELGEARIGRAVHLAGNLKSLSVDGGTGFYRWPSDCVEVDRITVLSGAKYAFRPAAEVVAAQNSTSSCSNTNIWAIDGRTLIFSPDIGDFVLKYYSRTTPLATLNTNWLLDEAPDLYLYAGLCEAARFSKEAEQEMSRYENAFAGIVAALRLQDAEASVARSAPIRRR